MLSRLFAIKALVVQPNWPKAETHEINLSGNRLSFTIPGRFSKDFPVKPIKTHYNLYDPELYRDWPVFLIAERWWDYSGYFWQGRFGTMSLRVSITKVNPEQGKSTFDLDHLETHIESELISQHEPINKRNLEKGATRLIVTLPQNYDRIEIDGKRWVQYRLGGFRDTTAYATPITENHYLKLAFNLMASDPEEDAWLEHALADVGKVLSGIHLEYTESTKAKIQGRRSPKP